MSPGARFKIGIFFKTVLKGMAGIAVEVIFVALLIVISLVVCLVWWGVF